jgi:hypothetical protein
VQIKGHHPAKLSAMMTDLHVVMQTDQVSCCPARVLLHARLAEKIRAARVNKERSLQLQEKAQLAAQEKEYDKVYDTVSDRTATMQEDRPVLTATPLLLIQPR